MAPMATQRDFYEVLGVSRDASDDEIAAAYRQLAIRYHPDSNPGNDEVVELFKEAAEAYDVLGDSEKRARYDRYGLAGVNGNAGASHFSNVEDIFEAFGDLFGGGVFGNIFGGGRRRGPRRGADIQCRVDITLEEAAAGVKKEVSFRRSKVCETCHGSGAAPGSKPETCPQCDGHGQVIQASTFLRVQTTCPACGGRGSVITEPCRSCRGQGHTADRVRIDVAIPAGVDDGMRVRVSGEGEPSPDGGPRGDLYCHIVVKPHVLFARDGDHLLLEVPITYSQAALGAEIEVPTLQGREQLKVPAATQSGEVFRIRGCGLPDPHGRRVGDLHVRVVIEVPKKLSPKAEELLRELAEEEHADVNSHRKSFLQKIKDYFIASDDAKKQQANAVDDS